MNRAFILVGLVPLLVVTGCSTSAATPAMHSIQVQIVDAVPLTVYQNYDDSQCQARGGRGPEVTIADGAGTILAATDGPNIGGTVVIHQSCTVEVDLDSVAMAEVYTVTVTPVGGAPVERTVSGVEGVQIIRVDL